MSWLTKPLEWFNRFVSNDPLYSNSRLLQTLIVANIITIVWLAVGFNGWKIDENVKTVLVTLIVSGAGAYAAKQVAGGGNA